jgi:ATP-binding cassette subfamily B protein
VESQDLVLFNTSVEHSIAYGQPSLTPSPESTIMEAAQMHGWITSFLDGYEVRVGEAGVRGNEGEKQHVAIARAMVNKTGCCFWMR